MHKAGNSVAILLGCTAALGFALLLTAERAAAQTPWVTGCAGVPSNRVGAVTWTPALCEEFNGDARPPDTNAWSFDLGGGGWGNEEVEIYCGPPGYPNNPPPCPTAFSTQTANSYLDGRGHLVIQVLNSGGVWYSARLKTQGIQSFQYGRIEASIKIPNTSKPGLWPAFWWLGNSYLTVSWPDCGEADIMENWAPSVLDGPGPTQNRSTIHTARTGGIGINGTYDFASGQRADGAFYAYGVVWSANMIQFYVKPAASQVGSFQPFFIVTRSDLPSGDTWPFNTSAFLLANVAVGGTLGGSTANVASPQFMMIDYIRQYKPSTVPPPILGHPERITVTAGATAGNTSTLTPALAPGTGYVYFSCDTTAPHASCSITTNDPLNHFVAKAGANPPESVTVTVTTTGNARALPLLLNPKAIPRLSPTTVLALALLMALVLLRARAVRRSPGYYAVLGILILAITIGVARGSDSSTTGTGSGGSGSGGTSPGSYTVTVYAFTESNMSRGANGNADASVTIPLTVNSITAGAKLGAASVRAHPVHLE